MVTNPIKGRIMKNYFKIGIFCLVYLITFSTITPIVLSATTIGDTTFPSDIGKKHIWNLTAYSFGETPLKGIKYRFTVDSITQGVHMTVDSLIVNATTEYYHPALGWNYFFNNSLYLAANRTQNYLYFDYDNYVIPYIIPTPINLTLVAEALAAFPSTISCSVDGNTIIVNSTDGVDEKFTFNSNGFVSVALGYEYGELITKLVLVGGKEEISFGIYFIISTFLSIAATTIFVKNRKLKVK